VFPADLEGLVYRLGLPTPLEKHGGGLGGIGSRKVSSCGKRFLSLVLSVSLVQCGRQLPPIAYLRTEAPGFSPLRGEFARFGCWTLRVTPT